MNESVRNKMKKRCGWIWNVSNFFYYAGIIGFIIVVIFGVFALFQPSGKFTLDSETASVMAQSITFHLNPDLSLSLPIECLIQNGAAHEKQIFLLIYCVAAICEIPTLFILWKLRTIFDSLDNEQTPFTRKNCKSLAHISYTLILLGFLSAMLPNIAMVVFGFTKHVRFDFDFNQLFLGCIALALSYFFEYGVVLQQESDELL